MSHLISTSADPKPASVHHSDQTFHNTGYSANCKQPEPAVVQPVKHRIGDVSDKLRTSEQSQQAYDTAAADRATDIQIQNVLPLHDDTNFCLQCPAATAAYSATDVTSLGHLPTSVQTAVLDTTYPAHPLTPL